MFIGEVRNKIKIIYRYCKNNNYRTIKIILMNYSEIDIPINPELVYEFTENKEIVFKTPKGKREFLKLKCCEIRDIIMGVRL